MKRFTYQILRYIPDRVSGEFANVGVVVFNPDEKYLSCKVIERIGRVHHLFPEVHSRHFISTLKAIRDEINLIGERLTNELNFRIDQKLSEITSSVLAPDDSALIFTSENTALDTDLDIGLDDLFVRLARPETLEEGEVRTDHDVWQKIYKPLFDRLNLTSRLSDETITTANGRFSHGRAARNGQLHLIEPTSFNLTRSRNIQDKVFKLNGMLQEYGTSKERIKVHLLVKMPKKSGDRKFVRSAIRHQSGNSSLSLVTEETAANDLQLLIDELNL